LHEAARETIRSNPSRTDGPADAILICFKAGAADAPYLRHLGSHAPRRSGSELIEGLS
jgi:hypothetical protein